MAVVENGLNGNYRTSCCKKFFFCFVSRVSDLVVPIIITYLCPESVNLKPGYCLLTMPGFSLLQFFCLAFSAV